MGSTGPVLHTSSVNNNEFFKNGMDHVKKEGHFTLIRLGSYFSPFVHNLMGCYDNIVVAKVIVETWKRD